MAKTISAARQVIYRLEARMEPLYDALLPEDQRRLDQLFNRVVQHRTALNNTGALLKIVVLLVLMMLEVWKHNINFQHAQYNEIKRLRKAMEKAGFLEGIENEDPALAEAAKEILEDEADELLIGP
jgi:hypothetical protein